MGAGGEEFDCIDCGAPIVRFGGWPDQPKRCAGCEFLTWIDDAPTRAAMRAHMLRDGIIGPDEAGSAAGQSPAAASPASSFTGGRSPADQDAPMKPSGCLTHVRSGRPVPFTSGK
jgi:hypothetical protein